MKHIVVIFQATQLQTEALALAFGLGAVQAGASIRLRHLAPSPSAVLAHAGYGRLRPEDLAWAQGVAIFWESSLPTGQEELISAFEGIGNDPANAGKTIFLSHSDRNADSVRRVESTAKSIGFEHFVDLFEETPTPERMTHVARSFIEGGTEEI
jgi:hypothetical protein